MTSKDDKARAFNVEVKYDLANHVNASWETFLSSC